MKLNELRDALRTKVYALCDVRGRMVLDKALHDGLVRDIEKLEKELEVRECVQRGWQRELEADYDD